MAAERRVINPWSWQDEFSFVQANEVRNIQRMLICAGQAAIDAEGSPLHQGDMRAQFIEAMDNLETVLREAGFMLSDVMRLNYFTTDVDRFFEVYDVLGSRLAEAGCRPASMLVGVARLAYPEMLIARSKLRRWRSSWRPLSPRAHEGGRLSQLDPFIHPTT
jgi:enamine deaminase RidA (YjgF/YER057c/UK114 family)